MTMENSPKISIEQVAELSARVIQEVEKAVVGKREVLQLMMAAFLSSGGHILLEDYPGLAKTLIANSFAMALGMQFKRIQFTPDLLPGDITGGYVFESDQNRFMLRKGPIFTNILLADEINRASPKTQSALLEAMQEYQVTLEGETLPLPDPFIVIATQNPIEYEGTFPLPEAQLDRFMVKLSIGYPSPEEEDEILKRRAERKKDVVASASYYLARNLPGDAGNGGGCLCGRGCAPLYGRPGGKIPVTPPGFSGSESARIAGSAQVDPRLGCNPGPKLRGSRRYQAVHPTRPVPSHHPGAQFMGYQEVRKYGDCRSNPICFCACA